MHQLEFTIVFSPTPFEPVFVNRANELAELEAGLYLTKQLLCRTIVLASKEGVASDAEGETAGP